MTEEDTSMADPTPGDDTGLGPGRGPTASTPRWVKVFGIIVIVLVLLVVIILVGGHTPPIQHGP